MEIVAPRLSKDRIAVIAEEFLAEHNPKRIFPLEIELIAEKLGIKVIPIPNLKSLAGTEGFIKPDLTQIGIDEHTYFSYQGRANFTIAHEIGHCLLHKDIYLKINNEIKLGSFLDYSNFMDAIPEDQYDWIEWQAYCFAGNVLVPKNELASKVRDLLNGSTRRVSDDVVFPIVEELSDYFGVSSQVIGKRVKDDGLVEIFSGYNR